MKISQVENSDSCQYLQTAQYCDSCKQGAMPVLNSWYRAEGWRGTSIVQTQFWHQLSAKNRLLCNTSTEPLQISVLAWYRCLVPRQYRRTTSSQVPCEAAPVGAHTYASTIPLPRQYQRTTSSQVTLRSRAGGSPYLCQHYASIAPVLKILLRYWRSTEPVVNLHRSQVLRQLDQAEDWRGTSIVQSQF